MRKLRGNASKTSFEEMQDLISGATILGCGGGEIQ